MRALVTGGGGFLGSAIVRMLLERGDSVVVLARGEYPELIAMGAELKRGDIRDLSAVTGACADVDVIFHVAAKPPPWGRRADYESINVGGTANVVEAAQSEGIPHLVYTSTPSVVVADGDVEGLDERLPYATHFLADYPWSKAQAEQLVLDANGAALACVALRPHLIWGPGDPHFLPRFVAKARSGQLRRIGSADPLVDTVYVDNAASAHLLAADRLRAGADIGGKAFFISNGEPIGVWTMVDRMLAAAGEAPVRGRVPVWLAEGLAYLFETIHRVFHLAREPRITRFLVHEVTRAHWFDISAARNDLGYEPTVSLEEGLARLEAWCAEGASLDCD
jgi:nucleoside-diphosphate-sugar epimerase